MRVIEQKYVPQQASALGLTPQSSEIIVAVAATQYS